MKINAAERNTNAFKFGFKSLRTDKKAVEQLKTGEKPIIDNNKLNIYAALNNLSEASDRTSIEFLLDVADNLAYGQGGQDSEFGLFLDEEGLTPSNRENTDWSQLLNDTIKKAISSSSDDVSDLEEEYNRIFSDNKELTPEQRKLLDLRRIFTASIVSENSLEDAETLAMTTRIRKNLDYFIASSEISMSQKQECLDKLIFFMSDDYQITPQLKDKKINVVDEMLNDMLIKTPEEDALTIKTVNQRQSGMCAAISICRKAIAYEDKSRYIDIVLEELKDSKYMSVYDITELESGKKVNIPKTNIDYDTAIAKGYRILDASAHNWMHNAHASGDGTIQTEYYLPFDDEDYGVYNDSSWYLGLEKDYTPEKTLLMALIKEKEFLKSFYKTRKNMKDAFGNVSSVKKDVFETQSAVNGKLNAVFAEIFPEKSSKELSNLLSDLRKFYSGKTPENEVNVPEKLPIELKQKIVADFIIASVEDITEEQTEKVRENSKLIYSMVDEYSKADAKLQKLHNFNSPKNKYMYNKKLFNVAAAHRLAIEADVNMPDGVVRFERLSGLKPREIQISNYLNSLKSAFKSESVRQRWADEQGNIPSQSELEADLLSDSIKLESTIPLELDSITNTIFDKSVTGLTADLFSSVAQTIREGNTQVLENVKISMSIKGDKHDVIEKLEKWADKLSDSPSKEEVLEGIRLLGYEDRVHLVSVFMAQYMNSLMQGISEEQYNSLVEKFGSADNISNGIEQQRQKFTDLQAEYNAIQEKWQIPSSRTAILNQLEKQNYVLSRKKLDVLKNKFDTIQAATLTNESIENIKERQAANQKLYKFSNDELEIFKSIEKSLPAMKKYCKMEYRNLNDILYDALEAQYANIGMLNGQFWVREEGSSGLSTNEQIRILEQMTGKPYHMETDALEAAKQIKKGKGSGIQSLSVDDSDYAFHAQYIPLVSSETFTNPITGEKVVQDVMWTDNSWGKAEKEHFWNGHNGFLYTDYGSGYGWKDGFILSDDYKIGLPVKDIHGAVGTEPEDNDKFGLFTDVVLPGAPVNIYQKLYKMFGYIFNIGEGQKYLSSLESQIANGYTFNIDELEGLDDIAEAKTNRISKRVEKEINSKADFDKLPEEDDVKFAFNKLAVYLSTNNPMLADSILTIDNIQDLKEAQDEIFQEHIESFGALIGKSDENLDILYKMTEAKFTELFESLNKKYGVELCEPLQKTMLTGIFYNQDVLSKLNGSLTALEEYFKDQIVKVGNENIESPDALEYFITEAQGILTNAVDETIRIKSLDSPVLTSSPLQEEFIAAIDKYLKPTSDEELLSLIQGLQMADYETVNKFFDVLTEEDVGLKVRKPYDYLLLYKAGDTAVNKAFSEVVSTQEIYANLNTAEDEESSTPEELYRNLYVKLSEMDVQKYIKAFKAEAFQKYQVRQAFPEPVVHTDESLASVADGLYNAIHEYVGNITSGKYIIEILSKYSNINENFFSAPMFVSLVNKQDVVITDANRPMINALIEELSSLNELSALDTSFELLNEPLTKLIKQLKLSEDVIDARTVGKSIKDINTIFRDFESTGITIDRFVQLNNEEMSLMKKNIKLMVTANIDPRYRDEAFNRIYKIIDMCKKEAPEEELQYEKDLLTDLIVQKHIVKNPTVLLKECVKMMQNGEQETEEYKVLRSYLTNALQVAQQTKIQYKLVQNQHEAISSKTKDMLSMFSVTMTDGSSRAMESEMGMLYLIEQLKNTGDNYTIMNLFLEQSGLSKPALNALLNNFEIEKTNELVEEKTVEIKDDMVKLDKLADIIEGYGSRLKMRPKSLPDAIEQFNKYMNRKLKGSEDVDLYNKFAEYINSVQYTDALNGSSASMIEPLFQQIIRDALQYVAEGINYQITYLAEVSGLIQERAELLASVRVPVDSDEYKKRAEFFKQYEETQHLIDDKQQEIVEAIQSCKCLGAEVRPC